MGIVESRKKLLRIQHVLEIVPISKSAWWQGVRDGIYPQPIKLGPRITCWRASEIYEMIDNLPRARDMRMAE